MDWGNDDRGIEITAAATAITTPPSGKNSKGFGLKSGDDAPYTSAKNQIYAHGITRQTGVSQTGSERGRGGNFYDAVKVTPPRGGGTKIIAGQTIKPKDSLVVKQDCLSRLPLPKGGIPTQPKSVKQTRQRESHTHQIQKSPPSVSALLKNQELIPPLTFTSPPRKAKIKKSEVIDLADDDDDQSDEPSPKPKKTLKLTALVETRAFSSPTASFGKFPSIPLEKVFVGKRYFGDSNICKLEIKASLRSFDLTLPDPTSSMPEINSKTSTTQLKNLSLTQKIHFQSISQIIYATNVEIGLSFIAFLLSSDFSWHSDLSIKCPSSLDHDFLQEEEYDFCPKAKDMDPSKYLVLIATEQAVRDFHHWISLNGQVLSSTYLNRVVGGADQHCDQYLMAYHKHLEAEHKDDSRFGSRRSRRRKRVESTISYETVEARRTVFRYPMIENAQDVITICGGDVMRLTDGELLNDNMVDLQIKRLVIWKKYYDLHKDDEFQNMSEKDCWLHFDQKYLFSASPTLRATTSESESPVTIIESDHNTSSIYAFSSMFYQKLTERKKSESYELVKKWTKNVDLFSKEFIFIPINMGSHWSLLCIVRPGLIRKETPVKKSGGSGKKRKRSIDNPSTPDPKVEDNVFVLATPQSPNSKDDTEISPTPASPDVNSSDQTNENIPCILFMDSLGIHGAAGISNTIYSYLESEWKNRKQSERKFNRTTMPLIDCKNSIPKQINGYDCGLYVTMYAKMICMLSPPSTEQEIETKFRNVFSNHYFSPEDVLRERNIMKKFCDWCESEWEEFKERKRNEKKNNEQVDESEDDEVKESYPNEIQSNECKEPEIQSNECKEPEIQSNECKEPEIQSNECKEPEIQSNECQETVPETSLSETNSSSKNLNETPKDSDEDSLQTFCPRSQGRKRELNQINDVFEH